MATYKYKNKETPGYFSDFSTIKSELHRGDRILFFDGGLTDDNITHAIDYMPGMNITDKTTYESAKKHLFNLSGLKVQIKVHTYINSNKLKFFDYWYNTDAKITLDCRKLPESKCDFFIGLLNKYTRFTTTVGTNEDISTKCFNIIPFNESHSLEGLENRRIFVIGNYGKIDKDGHEIAYYGYSESAKYKYALRQYADQSTPSIFNLTMGGSGFYGGEAHDSHDGRYIPSGGSNFILKTDTISELPSQYMSDYQQYLDIMSNGSITFLDENKYRKSEAFFEMVILGREGEDDSSTAQHFNGTDMISCKTYHTTEDNDITQCDIYYYNGKDLIKI